MTAGQNFVLSGPRIYIFYSCRSFGVGTAPALGTSWSCNFKRRRRVCTSVG